MQYSARESSNCVNGGIHTIDYTFVIPCFLNRQQLREIGLRSKRSVKLSLASIKSQDKYINACTYKWSTSMQ
eukprot:CFRG7306T1